MKRILLALALLASCGGEPLASRGLASLVEITPAQFLAGSGGRLIVPPEGLTISSAVVTTAPLELVGLPTSGEVHIEGSGRWIIEPALPVGWDGPLVLAQDIRLRWTRTLTGGTSLADKAIWIDAHRVVFDRVRATVDAAPPTPQPGDQGPAGWLLYPGRAGKCNLRGIEVTRGLWRATSTYGVGLLAPYAAAGCDFAMRLEGNRVEGFHGALYANASVGSDVIGNSLWRNSFGNIVANGRAVIEGNDIGYPGAGTAGDGIMTSGLVAGSRISRNSIWGGTCYGITVYNSADVAIEDNTVEYDITTGLLLSGVARASVRGNALIDGGAYGLALVNVVDSVATGNDLRRNVSGALFVSGGSGNTISGNEGAP